jgi:hypothetical protein
VWSMGLHMCTNSSTKMAFLKSAECIAQSARTVESNCQRNCWHRSIALHPISDEEALQEGDEEVEDDVVYEVGYEGEC